MGHFKDCASNCNCPKVQKFLETSLSKHDEQTFHAKIKLIHFANHFGDMDDENDILKRNIDNTVNLFSGEITQIITNYPLLKGPETYYSYSSPDRDMAKNLIDYVNAMYFVAHAG